MGYANYDDVLQLTEAIRDRLVIKDKTEAQALVASASYPHCVYYTSDTHCIVVKGQIYGRGAELGSAFGFATDTSGMATWDTNKLYITPTSTSGIYQVYSYENNSWEMPGTITIDIPVSADAITYDLTNTPDLGEGDVQSAIEAVDGKTIISETETVTILGSSFTSGKYWGASGLATESHFSYYSTLIKVKQGDVFTFKNYTKYSTATGGGPLCCIYNSDAATSGTRYNVNTYLIIDSQDSSIGTFTCPKSGWLGINLGSTTTANKNKLIITYQIIVKTQVVDRVEDIQSAVEELQPYAEVATTAMETAQSALNYTLVDDSRTTIINGNQFTNGKCWVADGLSTVTNFSAYTQLFEVKTGDIITAKNYTKYSSATGGGPFCCIYNSSAGTSGTRYNCNDVPNSNNTYTFTCPKDGWIGLNIGAENEGTVSRCVFSHKTFFQTPVNEKVEELAVEIDELNNNMNNLSSFVYSAIDEKQVDVIIFMGQSNMAGRGVVNSSYPQDAPSVITGAGYEFRAISDPTQLYQITKKFGYYENVENAIDDGTMKTGGSIPAFVNNYFKQTLTPIIGISASMGATSSNNWQPNGALLNDAIDRLTTCVEWLTDNGYTIRHKYMAWCQGEADGDNGVSKSTYITRFTNILNAMMDEGIEKCFMIQIGNYNGSTSGRVDDYVVIQEAQAEICSDNADVIMVSDSFKLMQSRSLMKDDWHYYQEAYNIVGLQAGHNAGVYSNVSSLGKF